MVEHGVVVVGDDVRRPTRDDRQNLGQPAAFEDHAVGEVGDVTDVVVFERTRSAHCQWAGIASGSGGRM